MFEAPSGIQGERVALIRKKRPEWQAGRFNGIGGHIEPGETALNAMVREFCEETGMQTEPGCWYPFARLGGERFSVEFFYAYGALDQLESTTDEDVVLVPLQEVTVQNSIPNLTWLIPMARSIWHNRAQSMVIEERYSEATRGDVPLVYLSGGIAGLSTEECNGWRSRAKELLCAGTLDPMRHDYRGRRIEDVAVIVDTDLRDIDGCDAVLVRVDRPSWGTAMEVRYAHQLGKPIVAFGEVAAPSAWLEYHCAAIYRDIESAAMHVNALLALNVAATAHQVRR
jgi:8-oxo-dGTP diphosphatase